MSKETLSDRTVSNTDELGVITIGKKQMEGQWIAPPAPNVIPVSPEEYISNVRSSCRLNIPNITRQSDHDKIMVMVCGGASAKTFLEDIRAKNNDDRYHVFCSNNTHDWLIENDIIPHTQFIIDPKHTKVNDIQLPHKDVRYMFGIGCVPELFEKYKEYNINRLFMMAGTRVAGELSDFQIAKAFFQKDEFVPVEGGSMAGLRAMTIANVLGYQTVEFYGFDSCFYDYDDEGYPIYYSYKKDRAENIMEAQTESGRVYDTTPVFSSQARQFIKWKHRLAWIKFVIHGDSLTSEIDRIDEEKNKLKGEIISDYMKEMNELLHKNKTKAFGSSHDIDVPVAIHAGKMAVLAGQLLKHKDKVSILDYGCGKGKFKDVLPPVTGLTLYQYDPCVKEYSERPEPADILMCVDVLEHVEPDFLNDVLLDLANLTKTICYVCVATLPANKYYSDGQNCHLIVENSDWWSPKIRKYFDIAEIETTNSHFVAVLQKKGLNGKG